MTGFVFVSLVTDDELSPAFVALDSCDTVIFLWTLLVALTLSNCDCFHSALVWGFWAMPIRVPN